MKSKNQTVVYVGINHAGTNSIIHARKLYPDVNIIAFDRNTNISFLGCGIALWISGVVKNGNDLFYANSKVLQDMKVDVRMEHDVIDVDFKNKVLKVKDLKTGSVFDQSYDKVVFGTGSWPITPPIPGLKEYLDKGVYLSKLYQHAETIIEVAKKKDVKNAVVIGAGYIGVELAEALEVKGKKVTLVDGVDRIMPRYFDPEFTEKLESKMVKNGIELQLNQLVQGFEGDGKKLTHVLTNKGKYKADMAILCIGFAPNTKWIIDAAERAGKKLELTPNKAIIVDEYQRAKGLKDVFVIGDSCAMFDAVRQKPMNMALATNAVKSGLNAAANLFDDNHAFEGICGTNGISIYGENFASTGMSEVSAQMEKVDYKSVTIEDNSRPEFMTKFDKIKVKVVFDAKTRRVIGAQIWSDGHHDEYIITFSLAIQKGMKVDELGFIDVHFLPHYNKPHNIFLRIAMAAAGK